MMTSAFRTSTVTGWGGHDLLAQGWDAGAPGPPPLTRGLCGSGQHLGVKKCSNMCSRMTTEIPKELLIHYQRNQESCGKRAIM